jgi:hypothetical protein
MLEDFKRRAAQSELRAIGQRALQEYCRRRELNDFHSLTREEIRASTKALLAVPREPVMNPCL